QRVDDLRAVRIAAIGDGEVALRLGYLVVTQQVDAQLGVRGGKVRTQLDRVAQQLDGLPIAARDDVEVRNGLVHFAVMRVVLEGALDPRALLHTLQQIRGRVQGVYLEGRQVLAVG